MCAEGLRILRPPFYGLELSVFFKKEAVAFEGSHSGGD